MAGLTKSGAVASSWRWVGPPSCVESPTRLPERRFTHRSRQATRGRVRQVRNWIPGAGCAPPSCVGRARRSSLTVVHFEPGVDLVS